MPSLVSEEYLVNPSHTLKAQFHKRFPCIHAVLTLPCVHYSGISRKTMATSPSSNNSLIYGSSDYLG